MLKAINVRQRAIIYTYDVGDVGNILEVCPRLTLIRLISGNVVCRTVLAALGMLSISGNFLLTLFVSLKG